MTTLVLLLPSGAGRDIVRLEPEIRDDAKGWSFACLAIACGPLSDEKFRAYVALSGITADQGLTGALFAGFGAVFQGNSCVPGAGRLAVCRK